MNDPLGLRRIPARCNLDSRLGDLTGLQRARFDAMPESLAVEVAGGQFVRFQEGLLGGPQVSPMEGSAARHPCTEKTCSFLPLPTQLDLGFVPDGTRRAA